MTIWRMLCFGLFDIVVQEYDYLADAVFGLFDIATFNNISAISWQSVLLVEET